MKTLLTILAFIVGALGFVGLFISVGMLLATDSILKNRPGEKS